MKTPAAAATSATTPARRTRKPAASPAAPPAALADAVPVAVVVRVSTSRQETDRQECELAALAAAKGWRVVEVCRESISGDTRTTGDMVGRDGLHRALALAKAGAVRKVVVHEVSRLARRNSVTHAFVEALEDCGVSLYWHAQSIETLLPDGKRNPAAAIMLALLAEMARAERDTLRERILSGLEHAKTHGTKSGMPIGRPRGASSPSKLLARHADVVRLLKAGQSYRHAAAIARKGLQTVVRVAAALRTMSQE